MSNLLRWVWVSLVLVVCLIGLTACRAGVAANNVTHLTLWHGVNPPPNRDVLQRLVDRFNQTHPQIQVESLYVGQGDQQIPKILSAVVGGVPPNLLWYAPMLTGQLVELDAIVPLEDWLDPLPIKQDIDPTLFESMQWEGHLWSVPFSVNNVGVFYRPSLFAAAGTTELPQTWNDFRQVARRLTNPQTDQYGLLLPLGKGEWTVFMWLPFLWSGGGEVGGRSQESGFPERQRTGVRSQELGGGSQASFVERAPRATVRSAEPELGVRKHSGSFRPESNFKIDLVNDGAIAALQFWRDLIEDGSVILSQPERGYELDQFLAGKVAMQLTGPWTLGQLQATGVDFAVMPIPVLERPATSIGGENLFIFKTSPAEEQAAQVFAEYVLSEEFQTEWAIATGYLPVNLQARQNPKYQAFLQQQPVVKVFLQQAQYGRSRPIFPGYGRLSDALGRAIEAVLLGKSTPEAALGQAQQRLERVLEVIPILSFEF
ncbi:MAG: ABC transporter substrate-binding protein [Leptolyngbya sp. IPPAS B-1204]|nr:MAG: ABC transporter substrate-binding protein [Leptolyngbya sp. IPPAS B-1204]